MPLNRAAVSCLGVSLNPSYLAVHFCGRLDEVSHIIGDARGGAIIKHERPRVRVELLTCRCVGRTIRPGCSHERNGVMVQLVPRDFLVSATSGSRASMTFCTMSAANFYLCYLVEQRLSATSYCFNHRFDPHILGGSEPLWDIRLLFFRTGAVERDDKQDGECQEEGCYRHPHVVRD